MRPMGMGQMPMGRPPMGRPPMGRPPIDHPNGAHSMPLHKHASGNTKADDYKEKDFDLKQMEKESEEMVKLNPLNKHNATFHKTTGGLSLVFNQITYEDVQLIETFPFTDPYVFISVRNIQNKNKEIGLIEDLEHDFDSETITLLKEYLEIYYHMPVIEKIVSIKESGGYSNFTVMTNFGEAQFSLRSNGSYITTLNEKRLIIQDLEGNRFEIPDKHQLSSKDLKKLDLFM